VQGLGHAAFSALAAGTAGAAVGVAVSVVLPVSEKLLAVGVAVVAAGCAVIAFGVVAYLLDDGDLRMIMARLRRLARPRA